MPLAVPVRRVAPLPLPDRHLALFERFVAFFCDVFNEPQPLKDVPCRDSYKEYVPRYYRGTFTGVRGGLNRKHLKWFRRLAPVLSLPEGSTVVDWGGGYGLDSIFLAACGYKVVFYEITLNHIAICEHLKMRFEASLGQPLDIRCILADAAGDEPFGEVDAIILDEVAHHIEPVEDLFAKAARLLKPGRALFLLEPNFWNPVTQAYFLKVRGFKTVLTLTDETTGKPYLYGNEHIRPSHVWSRLARKNGFHLVATEAVVPWGLRRVRDMHSRLRALAERAPGVRHLLASHLTFVFIRS